MSSNISINRICEQCGKVFLAKTTTTRFCSRLCNKRLLKKKERGIKTAHVDKIVEKMVNKTSEDLSSREFLTVRMATRLLGVSERVVYGMITSGRIRSVNLAQRKTIIYRQDIDDLFKLPQPAPATEKEPAIEDCYHMGEAQAKFSISEKALFEIIKRNQIKKFQAGKFVYVPKTALDKIFNLSA